MRALSSTADARGSQVFVNLAHNGDNLDNQGFSPFAELKDPEAGLAALNNTYEEKQKIDQVLAKERGQKYWSQFPQLSTWTDAVILR